MSILRIRTLRHIFEEREDDFLNQANQKMTTERIYITSSRSMDKKTRNTTN